MLRSTVGKAYSELVTIFQKKRGAVNLLPQASPPEPRAFCPKEFLRRFTEPEAPSRQTTPYIYYDAVEFNM
jgi:hypothetical protein